MSMICGLFNSHICFVWTNYASSVFNLLYSQMTDRTVTDSMVIADRIVFSCTLADMSSRFKNSHS